MEGDNWEDLFAVVRGSLSSSNSPTSSLTRDFLSLHLPPPLYNYRPQDPDILPFFPDNTTALQELEELCKPFLPIPQPPPVQPQPLPSCSPFSSPQSLSFFSHHHQAPSRSKRRKNQQKRVVCQVPADGLSSDVWAWRKYGQKPIKGSPFPRGYYRCSSSKGCPARKQVERSRKDPNMFVVTYTAEHNHPVPTHRNSLAGSTRQRSSSSISVSRFLSNKGLIGRGGSGKGESSSGSEVTNEEKKGVEGEEEGVVLMREMMGEEVEDMVFIGLEEIEEAMCGLPVSRGEEEEEEETEI